MRIRQFLSLSLSAFALVAMATAAPARAASSAGCDGFNGRWDTTWPGMTTRMRISGTNGVYSYKGGTLTGKFSHGGMVFSGTYAENTGATGYFHFTLSGDGNTFGGWYATSSNPDQRVTWSGICLGS